MPIYFNTNAFEGHVDLSQITITTNPAEATLAVMGAKTLNFDDFKNLKAIYRFGIGAENVPFDLLNSRSIQINFPSEATKQILFESTADFTSWLIYYMLFWPAMGNADKWTRVARRFVGNQKLLVIGTGQIGSRVVKRMQPLMPVSTFDALKDRPEDLETKVAEADVITIHIPGTDQNKGFFGEKLIGAMKPDAVLINTARGSIVDENALYQKLESTACRAAFDVFWQEPYKGPLKNLGPDKFLMTPHTASMTKDFIESAFQDVLGIVKSIE